MTLLLLGIGIPDFDNGVKYDWAEYYRLREEDALLAAFFVIEDESIEQS